MSCSVRGDTESREAHASRCLQVRDTAAEPERAQESCNYTTHTCQVCMSRYESTSSSASVCSTINDAIPLGTTNNVNPTLSAELRKSYYNCIVSDSYGRILA